MNKTLLSLMGDSMIRGQLPKNGLTRMAPTGRTAQQLSIAQGAYLFESKNLLGKTYRRKNHDAPAEGIYGNCASKPGSGHKFAGVSAG